MRNRFRASFRMAENAKRTPELTRKVKNCNVPRNKIKSAIFWQKSYRLEWYLIICHYLNLYVHCISFITRLFLLWKLTGAKSNIETMCLQERNLRRRQWRHNVTSRMTRHHIFAPTYWLLIYLQCEWIFLLCGVLRNQIKVLGEIKHLFGQFRPYIEICRVCKIYGRLGSASPSIDFTNPTYFYVRSGTDQISNNVMMCHQLGRWASLYFSPISCQNIQDMHTLLLCIETAWHTWWSIRDDHRWKFSLTFRWRFSL